jgi:hypothetical protein
VYRSTNLAFCSYSWAWPLFHMFVPLLHISLLEKPYLEIYLLISTSVLFICDFKSFIISFKSFMYFFQLFYFWIQKYFCKAYVLKCLLQVCGWPFLVLALRLVNSNAVFKWSCYWLLCFHTLLRRTSTYIVVWYSKVFQYNEVHVII